MSIPNLDIRFQTGSWSADEGEIGTADGSANEGEYVWVCIDNANTSEPQPTFEEQEVLANQAFDELEAAIGLPRFIGPIQEPIIQLVPHYDIGDGKGPRPMSVLTNHNKEPVYVTPEPTGNGITKLDLVPNGYAYHTFEDQTGNRFGILQPIKAPRPAYGWLPFMAAIPGKDPAGTS